MGVEVDTIWAYLRGWWCWEKPRGDLLPKPVKAGCLSWGNQGSCGIVGMVVERGSLKLGFEAATFCDTRESPSK